MEDNHPYKDRTIKFEQNSNGIIKETHFDLNSNTELSREFRKSTLPKFDFDYSEKGLKVEIKHQFIDEIDYSGIKLDGIDVETIITEVFDFYGNSKSLSYQTVKVNKEPYDYKKTADEAIDFYLETLNGQTEIELFLKETYQELNSTEKANYLYSQVLFEDRMQGGSPTSYKHPVVPYISKWFVDFYGKYDDNYIKTLIKLLKKFEIDYDDVREMLKHKTTSTEWKDLASKNQLDQ